MKWPRALLPELSNVFPSTLALGVILSQSNSPSPPATPSADGSNSYSDYSPSLGEVAASFRSSSASESSLSLDGSSFPLRSLKFLMVTEYPPVFSTYI